MKNTTVEEIEAIMKEAEDVEIHVPDSECVFVPKTWLYSKLTTPTQHHQDELREVYREILQTAYFDDWDCHVIDYDKVVALAQSRGINL